MYDRIARSIVILYIIFFVRLPLEAQEKAQVFEAQKQTPDHELAL